MFSSDLLSFRSMEFERQQSSETSRHLKPMEKYPIIVNVSASYAMYVRHSLLFSMGMELMVRKEPAWLSNAGLNDSSFFKTASSPYLDKSDDSLATLYFKAIHP